MIIDQYVFCILYPSTQIATPQKLLVEGQYSLLSVSMWHSVLNGGGLKAE